MQNVNKLKPVNIVNLETLTIVGRVPDMAMSEDCGPGHYSYKQEFIRCTLRMKTFMNIVNSQRKRIAELENQLNNKSCNCKK